MRLQKVDSSSMPITLDDQAADWTELIERLERSRSGCTRAQARVSAARLVGVSPGTLENIERGRGKGVRHWVTEKIRAAVIRALEQEISRLEHELELARAGGARVDCDAVQRAFAALDQARRLIRRDPNVEEH